MVSFSAIATSKGSIECIYFFLHKAYSFTQFRTFIKPLRGFVIINLPVEINPGSPNVIDARAQSISRGVHNGVAFAKFKAHKFSYLNIASLGTDYVLNGKECGVACVNIPSCFSFNLAAFYDINERILCELLPSDKDINSDKFISSQSFHHFSIGVSISL